MVIGRLAATAVACATLLASCRGAADAPAVDVAPAAVEQAAAGGASPAALAPDAFDKPAATSVAEADKARENVPDGDIRHIVPGMDLARAQAAPAQAPPAAKGGHEHHAPPPRTEKPAPRAAAPQAAPLYVCPMHPEVTSDKPGTCPKCGMALVKKKG